MKLGSKLHLDKSESEDARLCTCTLLLASSPLLEGAGDSEGVGSLDVLLGRTSWEAARRNGLGPTSSPRFSF